MLLNSHISAYARCLAGKVCGLVRSTWGTSQSEDKLGARDKILNTKVAFRACAGQTFLPLRSTPDPDAHHTAHGSHYWALRELGDSQFDQLFHANIRDPVNTARPPSPLHTPPPLGGNGHLAQKA